MSCSIYDESLLDDVQTVGRGGSTSESGSGGSTSKGGQSSLGGSGEVEAGSGGDSGNGHPGGSAGASGTLGAGAVGGTGTDVGGTSSTTGGAGAGGSVNPPTGVDVLDDMEDGNFYLFAKPPRFGYWYVAGDTTAGAMLSKIEQLVAGLNPAREASSSAVHFQATGFKGWGATVGLTFADSTQKRTPYDSGSAVGVSFWVRGTVAEGAKLRVLFPVLGTDPAGTECGGEKQGECLDHFATQVSVTDKWQQVTILFSSLHQAGWGAPLAGFDAAHMLGMEWTSGVADADVWLDDLSLLRP